MSHARPDPEARSDTQALDSPRPRFGIKTAPSQVEYRDALRVRREADTIPEIEHAWLFDHLMPIGGDPNGPTFEGWTLLSALAAQTERLSSQSWSGDSGNRERGRLDLVQRVRFEAGTESHEFDFDRLTRGTGTPARQHRR